MKYIFMLLFVLTTVVSTSAFASNDNDGKNEGTKIELNNTVAKEVMASITVDFKLNKGLIVIQTPNCDDGSNVGWVHSSYDVSNPTGVYDVQVRTCVETISIPFSPPPGFITYTTTESRSVPVNQP